jgi:hypothetical protein
VFRQVYNIILTVCITAMKTRNVGIILVAIAVGLAVTLVSGLYKQTQLPENLWLGTAETWYGLPFEWRGYSQVGHVFYVNPPYWFSPVFFLLDVVFWFLTSSAVSFVALRFVRMRHARTIHAATF